MGCIIDALRKRRSIRKYTDEPIPEEALDEIIEAGLRSPTGKHARPWEFVVVSDRATLDELAEFREGGTSRMLLGAKCAIALLGDDTKSTTTIEDCAAAIMCMHLTASSLGVGSCWIQARGRKAPDGRDADDYLRGVLGYPDHVHAVCVLSLGMPAEHPQPRELDDVARSRVHREKF